MKSNEKIDEIIEYFRELRDLWQSKHKETIDEKIHNHTKYYSSISLIMTFVLIALTLVGILLTSFNTTSQDLSKITDTLSKVDIPNATEEYEAIKFNLTISEIEFKATSIQTTYGIIKIIMYGFFLTLIIIFLLNIFSAFAESGYYKKLRKSEDEIITLEEIITALYSLKIRFADKLDNKKFEDKILMFDRVQFSDYKNILLSIIRENETTNKI